MHIRLLCGWYYGGSLPIYWSSCLRCFSQVCLLKSLDSACKIFLGKLFIDYDCYECLLIHLCNVLIGVSLFAALGFLLYGGRYLFISVLDCVVFKFPLLNLETVNCKKGVLLKASCWFLKSFLPFWTNEIETGYCSYVCSYVYVMYVHLVDQYFFVYIVYIFLSWYLIIRIIINKWKLIESSWLKFNSNSAICDVIAWIDLIQASGDMEL